MARVNFDNLDDPRFIALGILMGSNEFDAIGRMGKLYQYCTERHTYVITTLMIHAVTRSENFAEKMIEADLGEVVEGGIRIKGTRGRIEWLRKARQNGRKGGRPKKPEANHMVTTIEPPSNPITITTTIINKNINKPRKFDFEALYQKYPLKIGKNKGLKTCEREIRTEEDYALLAKAINRYIEWLKEPNVFRPEPKHFSTFMNCWRDFTHDDFGKQDIAPQMRHFETPNEPSYAGPGVPDATGTARYLAEQKANYVPPADKEKILSLIRGVAKGAV